eukprot:TRINITY_DN7211_c0_g1_i1.p1 TRINITY_DN7211_c0_g1~~TRINITY_DN7211_c0_g1_i1.p1  ORF type:complete len:515 (+),score=53.57 TRINITY_DN7211_c0_g1_i1:110-1654(+)
MYIQWHIVGYLCWTLFNTANCSDQKEVIRIPSVQYEIFSGQLLNALLSGNSSHIAQVFNVDLDVNKSKVLALAVGIAVADNEQSSDVQVRARAYKKNSYIKSSTQAVSKSFGGEWDENDGQWGTIYIDKTSKKQSSGRNEHGKLVSVSYSEDKDSVAFAYADTQAIDDLVVQTEQITDVAISKLVDNQYDVILLAQDAANSIAVAIGVAIAKAYGYVDVQGEGGSAYAFSSSTTEAFARAVSLAIIQKLYVVDSHQITNAFAEAMGFLISRTAAQASIQVFSQGGSFQDQVEAVQIAIAESISRVLIKAFVQYQDKEMQIDSVVSTSTEQYSGQSYNTTGYDTSSIEVQNNCAALATLARAQINSKNGDQELQVALQNLMNMCDDAVLLRTYLPQKYQRLNNINACPYPCKQTICEKEVRKFDVVGLCDHYRQIVLSHFRTHHFCSCQLEFEDELAVQLAALEFVDDCPQQCSNRVCKNQKQQQEYSWRGTCGENDSWRIWQNKSTQQRCSCIK